MILLVGVLALRADEPNLVVDLQHVLYVVGQVVEVHLSEVHGDGGADAAGRHKDVRDDQVRWPLGPLFRKVEREVSLRDVLQDFQAFERVDLLVVILFLGNSNGIQEMGFLVEAVFVLVVLLTKYK